MGKFHVNKSTKLRADDRFDLVADQIIETLVNLRNSGVDRRFSASVLLAIAASEARYVIGAEKAVALLRQHADTINGKTPEDDLLAHFRRMTSEHH